MEKVPVFADVEAAQQRIAGHVHRTPVLTCAALDRLAGARLFFKAENFQRAGAFKARGAFNAVLALPAAVAGRGVVTHSSGNHGAALALAARERGVPATIVMPLTAPLPKKAAVAGYGARIVECEPTLAARLAAADAVIAETGGVLIPPFENGHVAAGQGTAALELLEEAGSLDLLLVPVGGGGLLAGTLAVGAARRVAVFGAEPEQADDAARGFRLGTMQPQVLPVATVADGLTTAMGAMTFAAMRAQAAGVVTVSEEAIIAAMRLVWERMKIVIEPSSAVPVAALLEGALPVACKRVGVVLTGGNVDLGRLPWHMREGRA